MWACSADTPCAASARLWTRLTRRNSRTSALPIDARSLSSCIQDYYLVYEMKSMERANHVRLIEQLRAGAGWAAGGVPPLAIPAERYRDPVRLERERARAFAPAPRVLAAARAIEPGRCVPVDVPGAA